MLNDLDYIYLQHDEPNRSCLLALRGIVLEQHKDISETVKYSMPGFSFRKKMLCYLWVDKKTREPYILFVEGKRLNHPKLESGNRSRMKILRVNPNVDIPLKTIQLILDQALNLHA